MEIESSSDVVVCGAGIAGLTAAAYLARAGLRVTVLEKARNVGGRGTTTVTDGFRFNLGPHALYRVAAGMEVVRDLGLPITGKTPAPGGAYAIANQRKHTLPGGVVSLLTTSLLTIGGKREIAAVLAGLDRIDWRAALGLSLEQWLKMRFRNNGARGLMEALFRLTCYANAPGQLDAGVAIRQLQLGVTGGVLYIDNGWQELIDGLRNAAEGAGASFHCGSKAARLLRVAGRIAGIELADGSALTSSSVILTGAPADVRTVCGEDLHLPPTVPAMAACLDIGVRRLPDPKATFAIGIDRPIYFSVHSSVARLAPDGAATINVAKYLRPGEPIDNEAILRELESFVDLLQPGWRDVVVTKRFLPQMVVTHHIPSSDKAGLAARLPVAVATIPGLFVAGDWVGADCLLSDASFASGREAARLAAAWSEAPGRAAA